MVTSPIASDHSSSPAIAPRQAEDNDHGLGRELFAGMRRNVLSAEEGACTWV
jgi:phosphogluconate dehydratase